MRWSLTEPPAQSVPLRLTLEAPARARRGEPVPLLFTVTNAGRESVTLRLLGRTPSADFRIADSGGRWVWSRLRGQTMLGALRLVPLLAGQGFSFRHTWRQRDDAGRPVPAGDYRIYGVLLTDDPQGLASAPSRLRIQP